MYSFIRESFWGRTIYRLSGRKFFTYKEEQKDYIIPEKYITNCKKLENENSDDSINSSSETLSKKNRIIVTFDGDDDPENPYNWPLSFKAIFIAEISLLTTCVYMASALYTPGIEQMMEELHVSQTVALLPLTFFVIGYGIGPMIFSPMSENAIFGRTFIYISTLFIFFILQIPTALVHDIASITVLRFLSGFFASPCLATGGASMGDITHLPYLPVTIALWCISCVCGPSLGPFFGSIITVKQNWQYNFWFLAMVSGICFAILSWALPETYGKTILRRKAQRLRAVTGNNDIISEGELENQQMNYRELAIETLWRPVEISIFEPVVLLINIYIALVYSILYLWFEAFPIVFVQIYDFTLIQYGTAFFSVLVGVLVGAVIYIPWIYRVFTLPIARNEPVVPEVFLPIMIVGSLIMPIGVFIFGWSATTKAHWIGPVIGSGIFSAGAFVIFQTGFNYLANSFTDYLASVFAGNDLFRSVIASVFPLFAHALFHNLSTPDFPVGWGSSVLGFISTAMILIPVLFYLNGPKLRAKSKYSSLEI